MCSESESARDTASDLAAQSHRVDALRAELAALVDVLNRAGLLHADVDGALASLPTAIVQGEQRPAAGVDHEEAADPTVMNLEETAALLRISRPTLLELAHRREIPCRKVGRAWRFHRQAVLDWLTGRVASRSRRHP